MSRGSQQRSSREDAVQKAPADRPSDRIAWNRLPPADVETELTFGVPANALKRVGETAPVTRWSRNRGRNLRLESIYYDTADGHLKKDGLGLRVRRIGRRFVQTLKAQNPHDPMNRAEWEVAVPSAEPDPSAFPSLAAQDHLRGVDPAALVPILVTRVRRHVRVLEVPDAPDRGDDAAVVELALDEGAIEANGAVLPISEVELELVRGDPAALYSLAERIHVEIPLRIETLSKAARGWCLADGAPPPWHKASKTKVAGSADVSNALDSILRDCLGHWLANHAVAVDGREPEGVHQVRVALRRMRSALSVFKDVFEPEYHQAFSGEVRWLADELGDARDWDVLDEEVLTPVIGSMGGDGGLSALQAAAREARQSGQERARVALRSPRATALVLQLGHWIESGGCRRHAGEDRFATLAQPIRQFAIRQLNKAHRRVTRAGAGFEKLSDDARHIVRIRLKRLRYLSEFFAQLYAPRRARRFVKALSAWQNDLGRRNDLAVADQRLRSLGEGHTDPQLATAAGIIVGWHGRSLADDEADLVGQWRRFAHAAPFWTPKR